MASDFPEKAWPKRLIRRGPRVGAGPAVWWQELPDDSTPEAVRSIGYEVVEVVPVFSEKVRGSGWRCEACGFFTATEPADPCPRCESPLWDRADAPCFSASLVEELAKAGSDAWSEIEEALNSFGEGTLDEDGLLVRLRATQSKLLPCTKAQSSLGVKA
jgi:hypothetical protein